MQPTGVCPLDDRSVSGKVTDTSGRVSYYCHYCDTHFDLGVFRNSQAFGAHCSNCSRRKRPPTTGDKSPLSSKKRRTGGKLTRGGDADSSLGFLDDDVANAPRDLALHAAEAFHSTSSLVSAARMGQEDQQRAKEITRIGAGLLLLRNDIRLQERDYRERLRELKTTAEGWLRELRRDCTYAIQVLEASAAAKLSSTRETMSGHLTQLESKCAGVTSNLGTEKASVDRIVVSRESARELKRKLDSVQAMLSSKVDLHSRMNRARQDKLSSDCKAHLTAIGREVRQRIFQQEHVVKALLAASKRENSFRLKKVLECAADLQGTLTAMTSAEPS